MDERQVRARLRVLAREILDNPCSRVGATNTNPTSEDWQRYRSLSAEYRLLLTPMFVLDLLGPDEPASTDTTPISTDGR